MASVRYLKVVKWAIWVLWMLAIVLAARASGGWRRFDLLFGNEAGLPPRCDQLWICALAASPFRVQTVAVQLK